MQLERLLKRRLRRTQNCKSLSFPRLCRWDKEQLRRLTLIFSYYDNRTIQKYRCISQVAAPLLVRQEAVEASCTSLLRWYFIGRKWFSAAPKSHFLFIIFFPQWWNVFDVLDFPLHSRAEPPVLEETIKPKSVCNTNNLLDPDLEFSSYNIVLNFETTYS